MAMFSQRTHPAFTGPVALPRARAAVHLAAPSSSACRARRCSRPRAALAAGSGVSSLADTREAARAAVAAAASRAPPSARPAALALVAATSDRDAGAVAAALRDALPATPFVGATSCTAVLTPAGRAPSAVGVLLLYAPDGCLGSAARPFESTGVADAATDAARELADAVHGAAAVHLVYMMTTPGAEETVLRSVRAVFGDGVPVVGGTAADNDVSGAWSIFYNGAAFSNGVALFAVAGVGVKAGACLHSPYLPTSVAVTVTAAENRSILELDGRPAAEVMHELVGDALIGDDVNVLAVMSTRPCALRRDDEDYIAVHVADVDKANGTVALFAETRVGDELVIMKNQGGEDSATAAGHAIRTAYNTAKANGALSKPVAGVLVYCGGLGIAVGEKLEDNLTLDLAELPGLPAALLGFTAFGEQGPVRSTNTAVESQHRNLSIGMALFE